VVDISVLRAVRNFKNISQSQLQEIKTSIEITNDPEIKKNLIFHLFLNQLKCEKRFFCDHEFFNILKENFERYTIEINEEKTLYRARRTNDVEFNERRTQLFEIDYWLGSDDTSLDTIMFQGFDKRGSFVPEHIYPNRANTSSISVLYCADSLNTAISEVRPFKSTVVSVASIKLNKTPLKLFNLTYPEELKNKAYSFIYNIEHPYWHNILSNLFSIPHEHSNNDEYLATQCISEYIRLSGKFDGIIYESSLDDEGNNIVLFNCKHDDYSICEPINSNIYIIEKFNIRYKDMVKGS